MPCIGNELAQRASRGSSLEYIHKNQSMLKVFEHSGLLVKRGLDSMATLEITLEMTLEITMSAEITCYRRAATKKAEQGSQVEHSCSKPHAWMSAVASNRSMQ